MANAATNTAVTSASAQVQNKPGTALTPELVREVAEKVYTLWLFDLKIERERWRNRRGSGLHNGEW